MDAAQTYATWLYEARQLQLTTSFVNVAQLRFEGLSGLVKIGERAGIDTVEAAILQQGRDLDRQSVQTAYIRAENEIRFYYGTALQTNLPAPLLTRDSLDKLFEKALKYYSLSAAQNFSANPQLQQYNAKRGLLETDARLKRELIKPKLDVSYNFLNAANASDRLYFGTANYKYGASLSFPLLLRSARNEHKIARLQVMTNELEFQSKDAQVKTKGRYLFETAQLALNQVVVARRSVEFSKQLLEAERLKFENGESSLFLLNTRENKYLETELKLADYQLKFLTQVLQLVHLVGDLNYGLE